MAATKKSASKKAAPSKKAAAKPKASKPAPPADAAQETAALTPDTVKVGDKVTLVDQGNEYPGVVTAVFSDCINVEYRASNRPLHTENIPHGSGTRYWK